MADASGTITYLSRDVSHLFEEGTVLTFSVYADSIYPDDRACVVENYRQAIAEQNEFQMDYRVVGKNGVVHWVAASGAPRFSDAGDFYGYIGALVNVSDRYQMVERLEKSEATHRLLTENSSDLISQHAPDSGTYLYASPSFRRVLGFDPSELVAKETIYDHVHPDDVPVIRTEVLRQTTTGAESQVIEFRTRHRNGHYVWVATNVKVLTNPATNAKIGTVAVTRDITAERKATEELKSREERFRSLTKLSSDWYWETDEQERFTFRTEAERTPTGFPAQYILGKTRRDLAADENDAGLLEYFVKVARHERFRDVRYKTKGAMPGTVGYASISGEPVFADGAFRGYRGLGRDVTEEVEVADKFAQLAEENKALVENSLDIIALLDPAGRFLRINAAVLDILGYHPGELLGKQYTELLHPDDLIRTQAVDASLRTGQNTTQDLENRWICKDGRVIYLSLSVRWSEQQQLMYATARDVTERYRVQSALQKAKDKQDAMLESIGDAFFAVDNEWRVTYANRKAAAFVGTTPEKAIGRILLDVAPDLATSPSLQYYQTAMKTREKTSFEEYWKPTGVWVEARVYPSEDGISVYFEDITARREAESAIRKSEQRFREVIEMTPAGYLLSDSTGQLLEVNPALCSISGYKKEELVGQHVEKLFAFCPWEGVAFVRGGPTLTHGMEATISHRDGQEVHVLFNGNIKRDAAGDAECMTGLMTDITARKQAESRLEQLATHDTLTGLPNRTLLNDRLQQMLEHEPRIASIAVMFIDLDRFKEVNDSFGHEPGDMLLCEVARRLQQVLCPSDIVARLGGDEFVVAAHCSLGKDSAASIADKLLSMLTTPISLGTHEVVISASIGISMFPEDGNAKQLLFQNADTAMYRAKAAGRNCYCFFAPEMTAAARTRMTLELALRPALKRKEFELHYQPRTNLKTMSVVGMEALIRWNHPILGSVPPMQFIPIAEDTGLIDSIGQWVLEEACLQARTLMDKTGFELQIAVNLSARQLRRREIVEEVRAVLIKTGLPPRLLELELTETSLMEDIERSAGLLKELKSLGIKLALDDFGTGYCGLAYLRRFPIDVLKLDRSFVLQQDEGIDKFDFIKAFVDMAHTLKLAVVAEGVETEDVLGFLRSTSCDEAQGYYIAMPMPYPALVDYLTRSRAIDSTSKS